VCVEALALRAGSKAEVFDRLQQRLNRNRVRMANPPKPPPAYTRKRTRPAHQPTTGQLRRNQRLD